NRNVTGVQTCALPISINFILSASKNNILNIVHRLIEKPSGIIALLLGMLILSGSNLAKAQHNDEQHDSVMLILGSANPQTLQHRIEVGVSLYNSGVDFDRVVVSGGSGAHDSAICEASSMDSL